MLIVLIFVQFYFGNLAVRWSGESNLTLEGLDLLLCSHATVTWVLGFLISANGTSILAFAWWLRALILYSQTVDLDPALVPPRIAVWAGQVTSRLWFAPSSVGDANTTDL